MAVRGEKLGGRSIDRSTDVLGIVSGALFLRSNRVHTTLLDQCERFPRMGTTHKKRTCGVRGPAQEAYMSYVSGFLMKSYILISIFLIISMTKLMGVDSAECSRFLRKQIRKSHVIASPSVPI
jgi:hypothetical protein